MNFPGGLPDYGKQYKIIFGYLDSSNYNYLITSNLSLGCSTGFSTFANWRLHSVVGGSDSDTGLYACGQVIGTSSSTGLLTFCVDSDTDRLVVYDNDGMIAIDTTLACPGTQCGYGTGTTGGTTHSFGWPISIVPLDEFCHCGCALFVWSGWPSQIQVELSGFSDASCSVCGNLNGTFLLDFDTCENTERPAGNRCDYCFDLSDTLGEDLGVNYAWVKVWFEASGTADSCGLRDVVMYIVVTFECMTDPYGYEEEEYCVFRASRTFARDDCGQIDGITVIQEIEVALTDETSGGCDGCSAAAPAATITALA